MQESDLSKTAKTEASLFTILGQFGSPQFSIIQKICTCLGLGNLLFLILFPQSRKKWEEYKDRRVTAERHEKIAVALTKCTVALGLDLPMWTDSAVSWGNCYLRPQYFKASILLSLLHGISPASVENHVDFTGSVKLCPGSQLQNCVLNVQSVVVIRLLILSVIWVPVT